MQKYTKLSYLFAVLILLISCSEYHKVLNRGTIEEQYKMAVKMYETQKYAKALQLFEKITPSYRGKPQMERIQFMVSQSNFNEKNYSLAGYYFSQFAKNYPKSSKAEESEFLSALSYYKAAPRFSLDPTDTNKALEYFQRYIDRHPESDKLVEANKYYAELRYKLEKKAYEIAKTYYRTADYDSRNYKAAMVAFDNLLSDYLGTNFKEQALYYKLKSAYDYAMKSTFRRKAKRIDQAIKVYQKFKRSFPASKYMKDSNRMLAALHKEQKQLVKIKNGS
ncbi:MAG: outer membrane protein assembly factor BamD [Tenacibaculum sp.]